MNIMRLLTIKIDSSLPILFTRMRIQNLIQQINYSLQLFHESNGANSLDNYVKAVRVSVTLSRLSLFV